MRLIRGPIAAGATLAVLLAVAGGARRLDAQQTYPQTLYWGAGLIDVPVAWVSPVNGDFALAFSGQTFNNAQASAQLRRLPHRSTPPQRLAQALAQPKPLPHR